MGTLYGVTPGMRLSGLSISLVQLIGSWLHISPTIPKHKKGGQGDSRMQSARTCDPEARSYLRTPIVWNFAPVHDSPLRPAGFQSFPSEPVWIIVMLAIGLDRGPLFTSTNLSILAAV